MPVFCMIRTVNESGAEANRFQVEPVWNAESAAVTNVRKEPERFFLTVHQTKVIVRLDVPWSEFRDGDAGHVHKHRDRHKYSHASFWRAGEVRTRAIISSQPTRR